MNFEQWYFPARSVHCGLWEAEIFDFWVFSSELDGILLLWVRQAFGHSCWAHNCTLHLCSSWITCETNSDQLPAAKQECQSKWCADVVFSPKHPLPLILCLPSHTWLFYYVSLKIFYPSYSCLYPLLFTGYLKTYFYSKQDNSYPRCTLAEYNPFTNRLQLLSSVELHRKKQTWT